MTKITCLVFAASLAQAASFDVTQYGAVENGTTLASAAINKAIDAASAAGGGTVHFDQPNSADPTGRIKFGTESNGGFENITISNVTMRDIVNSRIFPGLGVRLPAPEGTPMGDIRRVTIANLWVYNAYPRYSSIISGIPGHDIEDVNLSNIRIVYKGDDTKEYAVVKTPENGTMYPEPRMFGVTPAYGFFIRHVKGVELDNVRLEDVNGFSKHNTLWAADVKLGRVDEKQF